MGMQPIGDNEMFNPEVLGKYIHHNISQFTCNVIETKVDELIAVPTVMEQRLHLIQADFDQWIMDNIQKGVSFEDKHIEFKTISDTINLDSDYIQATIICEIKENEKEK